MYNNDLYIYIIFFFYILILESSRKFQKIYILIKKLKIIFN